MQVIEVRCEATAAVDDIVLTFADGHKEYLQAKERVAISGEPWKKLWRDFAVQFLHQEFRSNHDRLLLYVGERRDEFRSLHGMAERAQGSTDWDDWHGRLTQAQKRLYDSIKVELEEVGLETSYHVFMFGCLRIHSETWDDLELSRGRYLPPCNVDPSTLFRLLRDRVGEYARIRKPHRADDLRASLEVDHDIRFELLGSMTREGVNHGTIPLLSQNRSRPQWFISSRLKGDCLRAEREAAIQLLETTGIIAPWASERNIPAGDYPYEDTCLQVAANSDGLLLIVDGELTPFCKREYDAAAKSQRTCFIFLKDGSVLDESANQFVQDQRARGKNIVRFRNLDELRSLLTTSLQAEFVRALQHARTNSACLMTPTQSARLR
jgi:hypothetical protein